MTDRRNDAPRDDELEPDDGIEELEAEAERFPAAAPTAKAGAAKAGPAKASRTAYAIDPALRIRDRASVIFVLGSTLVFGVIFLYAMGFGHGGAFTPPRTAPPVVSPSPGASQSAAPSGSPGASPATSPAPSPAASPAASPATSPAPSPATSPAAS